MKTNIHIFGRVSDIARVSCVVDDCAYALEGFLKYSETEYRKTGCSKHDVQKIIGDLARMTNPSYVVTQSAKEIIGNNGKVLILKGDLIIRKYQRPSGGLGKLVLTS